MAKPAEQAVKVIATNRKASHEFFIHERMEAGLVLVGSEVKSLRDGKVVIADGYAAIEKGEGWLYGIQINEYAWANRWNHEIKRKRKLLLHRQELSKLGTKTRERGYTLIPLSIYWKGAHVKIELGLCTHKKVHDKREAKRAADDKREMDRATKRGR